MSRRRVGRSRGPSIFRHKTLHGGAPVEGADRYQGNVTPVGAQRFEEARAKLAELAGRDIGSVSDGDVVEALARGWTDTAEYIASQK